MIRTLFGRFGLAARIGLSIAAAVVAIQVLVVAVFLLTPENRPPLYGALWLSDAVADLARSALSGAATEPDFLERLPRFGGLSVGIDQTPPRHLVPPPWPLNRVVATVRSKLADRPSAAVDAFFDGPWPLSGVASMTAPTGLQATWSEGPILPGEELLVPPLFLVTVDLGNGRWLTISPSERGARSRLLRSLAIVIAGTVLIGAIAVVTARGLVAPLGALAAAADRLGRERETTDIVRPAIPELAAIHDAFEAMQGRLKRFVDERTHMLAAISHDLRTPLARLRLQAEFVADEGQRAEMLDNIAALQDMLTETLSFAAGATTSDAPEAFDLASMLISLCDEASDAGGCAEYHGPNHAALSGRRTAIRRAFSNLIENAVRYGDRARVALLRAPHELTVTVSDDGPGIPPELFDKAFSPFQRLETSRNRESGGTGLGLAIARDIVLAHGGQTSLSNDRRRSKGLIVTVTFPSNSAPSSSAIAQRA
ncbi:sensor histidine kinase [Roseiarcus sp.]|uniref:sensor histidine kinase n=1 Tax=Roseiarcus sp. TaxID=1969460 RepID=UPI003C3281AF